MIITYLSSSFPMGHKASTILFMILINI